MLFFEWINWPDLSWFSCGSSEQCCWHLLSSDTGPAGFMIDSCCDSITRKILNDLSSDAPAVPRIEEEKAEEDSLAVAAAAAAAAAPAITTVTVPTPIYQTSSGQYSR